MSLNTITFLPGEGGLGRPLPGSDHISGMVFYDNTLPSGFDTSNRIKKILSPGQAKTLGILDDYSDETQATGTETITAVGANGDTYTLQFTEPNGKVVTLGYYKKVSTDTTVTAVATAIKNAINLGTINHGYSATNAAGVITVKARKGLGIYPQTATTPLSHTITGTIAGTLVQMSGGVASKLAIYNYHISEFFRIQPKGILYVGFYAVPGSYTFTNELQTMRAFSGGTIRQLAIYKPGANFATGDITAIQAIVSTFIDYKQGMSVLYAGDLVSVTDLSTLTDLTTLNSPKVSAVISQDGAGLGASLFASYGKSITDIGAKLGAVARAKVSESIAWVGKFNMSNGVELDTPAFANGDLLKTTSEPLQNVLNDQGYLFLRTFSDRSGSFNNSSTTCTSPTSDYCTIENNRTIDKAIRLINFYLTPDLASPLTLNPNGTLLNETVEYFKSEMDRGLAQMIRDGELSGGEPDIDPLQDVLATSTLATSAKLQPKGVARNILVGIQFVKQL